MFFRHGGDQLAPLKSSPGPLPLQYQPIQGGGLLASFRLAHRRGKGGRLGTFSKNRHFGFGRISEVAPMPLTKRPWTEEDIAKLKQMAQKKPPSEIAAALVRSIGATCVKAHQLKVSLRMPRRWVRRQLPSDGERAPMD